ncbi:MAG: methyltransferase [Actinobacteria bacterium]|nr:methyltransferase [Actinomycetota bacterium]MSY05216.1 methyltransferase [Actinomycetota bacterium]MSY67724.1 methyltransferase [Actinomycetota bacterium]MSZ59586.1 methyltransferase [Actinomycetota bacterium]MTA01514.1 methyltransferase [Actinomycetota bacterium]
MVPPAERIDIRPVLIKEKLMLQIASNDGRAVTTKNIDFNSTVISELLDSGFANILVESTDSAISIRVTKKGEAQIHYEKVNKTQDLNHDRKKDRLLDSADPYLVEVGISDLTGQVKPSRQDKYRQVEEFLRILAPALESAISAGQIKAPSDDSPLEIVDLGCGNAYLTFATHQYLISKGIPVHVTGIDIREQARERNSQIAKKLGIEKSIEFKADEIARVGGSQVDIAIALHACDTATDDAIAWAVKSNAGLVLVAPCCQHDLQSKLKELPEPWPLVTKHGILKERLADILTDSIRAQILRLLGYRTDVIEFIGGEHTPKNLLIRAVNTKAKPEQIEITRYQEMLKELGVVPALAERLGDSFTF